MKLRTAEMDPGGNLYAASYTIDIHWEKRMLQLVRPVAGNEVHLYWYSYPENKKIMTWDQDESMQEIMDYIANLPEKRDMADFTLP